MATKSKVNNNNEKKRLADLYRARREELRNRAKDLKLSEDDRKAAQVALQKLPKNSNFIRIRNRCELTGRPRAYLGKFGVCRIKFRELALTGMIPGVTKSSW